MPRRTEHYDSYSDDDNYEYYPDEYGDDAGYYVDDAPPPNRRAPLVAQAFDWGISGSILAIIILTIIYVLSPLDAIPDIVPVAGQVDDLAAILAGGGSISFLAVLRFVLRSRIGRWGCLIAIVLASIGAFTVFWGLIQLLDQFL